MGSPKETPTTPNNSAGLLDESTSAMPADVASSEQTAVMLDEARSPCGHNNWKTLRVKKHGQLATLQCVECQHTVKRETPLRLACRAFHEQKGSCPLDSSCPYMHISRPTFRRKKSSATVNLLLSKASEVCDGDTTGDDLWPVGTTMMTQLDHHQPDASSCDQATLSIPSLRAAACQVLLVKGFGTLITDVMDEIAAEFLLASKKRVNHRHESDPSLSQTSNQQQQPHPPTSNSAHLCVAASVTEPDRIQQLHDQDAMAASQENFNHDADINKNTDVGVVNRRSPPGYHQHIAVANCQSPALLASPLCMVFTNETPSPFLPATPTASLSSLHRDSISSAIRIPGMLPITQRYEPSQRRRASVCSHGSSGSHRDDDLISLANVQQEYASNESV